MAATYNSLYLNVRERLKEAGIESAQLEARELVCCAAEKDREQFYRDLPLYTSEQVEERTAELVRRRLTGEPVAYLIGEWEFYGLTLEVDSSVLIPRMDTEVLAERAILIARSVGNGVRVLDLCAGSGCIGLAIAAHVEECRVVLADRSEAALQISRKNVCRTGLQDRVSCVQADALSPPDPDLGVFDLIVCNPPYIPTEDISSLEESVRAFEPHLALDGGMDGLTFYRTICAQWGIALKAGGSLLFEVGMGQSADVEALLKKNGFQHIRSWQDTQGIWRVVEGSIP